MTSIADGSVCIQTSSESIPATPSWFGEVVLLTAHLRKHGVFNKINKQARFARRRFGRYDVIDFLAVLFGYAISGERTLEEFYERLQPFAVSFMALFERDRLPSRSALSRFLAALTEEPVEALRTLFLDDLLGRPLTHDQQTGGLVDRAGNTWVVFDIDGTREAARQRALPQGEDLPPAFRRLDDVCAPGYRAASAERLFGHGQPLLRRIVISGSAVSGIGATVATERNCARGSRLLAGIWLPISSHKNARCCASTGNMAMGRCSPMWLALRL